MGSSMTCKLNPCCGDRLNCTGDGPPMTTDNPAPSEGEKSPRYRGSAVQMPPYRYQTPENGSGRAVYPVEQPTPSGGDAGTLVERLRLHVSEAPTPYHWQATTLARAVDALEAKHARIDALEAELAAAKAHVEKLQRHVISLQSELFDERQRQFASSSKGQTMLDGETLLAVAGDCKVEMWPPRPKGGQHVGSGPAGVKITHLPSGIEAFVEIGRSQHINLEIAMDMILSAITHPKFR